MNADLLVCSLEVNAGCCELSKIAQCVECYFGRWQRGVDVADSAIKDQARVSPLCFDYVKAADGNAFGPPLACLSLSPPRKATTHPSAIPFCSSELRRAGSARRTGCIALQGTRKTVWL